MSNRSVVNLSINTVDRNFVAIRTTRNTIKSTSKRMYRRSYEIINNTHTIRIRKYKSMPCLFEKEEEKVSKIKVNTSIKESIKEAEPKQITKLPKLLGPNDIHNIKRTQAFVRGYLTRKRIEEEENKLYYKKQIIDSQIDYEVAEQLKYYDSINPKLKIKEYIKLSKNIVKLRNKFIGNEHYIWNEGIRRIFSLLFKLVQKSNSSIFITKEELHYYLITVLNLPIKESIVDEVIENSIYKSRNGLYSFKSIMTWYIMKREDSYSFLGYLQRYRRNKKQLSLSFCFDKEYIDHFFKYNLRKTIEKQTYLGNKPKYKFLLYCHVCGMHFSKCNQYVKHVKNNHGYYG